MGNPQRAVSGVPVNLADDGLLWLINASVLHPRGFALGLNGDGTMVLLGDGHDPWTFAEVIADDRFVAVEALFERARSTAGRDTDTAIERVANGMCRHCGDRSYDGPDGYCGKCR